MKTKRIPFESILFVCTNKREEGARISCANGGRCGEEIRAALKEELQKRGLKGRVRVSSSGCMDLCEEGPNVMAVASSGEQYLYQNVSLDDLEEIADRHFPS